MQTMKRPYQVTAAVLLVLSAFVAIESLKLKYYTQLGPGPGFFPFWLALCLAALSIVMFYQATFRPAEPKPEDFRFSRRGILRALAMCAAWVWAVVMLERLGYRLTMAVFFPFLLLTLGRVRWPIVVALSLLGSLAVYYLFTRVLSVPLPIGPFDGIFGPIDALFY